ncbi:hypothetical protein NPX13_g787 [Xylaria arbuscula]|uniref:Rhodopsin domain-containing protein n=1 Tax=Xylaria arbuscula TaxID=114810 RepID=A0A9W8NNW5_9PEZI|nr:hypothetical protein NPX13_g787 [Xylaria arbuscula]
MSAQPGPLYQTTKEILSESSFRAVIWFAVAICTVVYIIRYSIRLACWHKLLPEDYLMLIALGILIAIAGVLQKYVGDIYHLTHVQNGVELPGPGFEKTILRALRADGIVLVLGAIGTYTIKFNFLAFFYHLGHHTKAYLILWWASTIFTVSSLLINLGVIPYKCSFGNIIETTVECATEASVSHIYTVYILVVTLDVICDALIIAFPIIVTWRTKMNWRQKAVISAAFLLVGFTIGVTIVRVSIFKEVYDEVDKSNRKVFDTAWILFWLFVEYLVSFIINCIISFRSLWVNQQEKAKDKALKREKQMIINRQADQANISPRSRWQVFQQSLLDTFADLEGTTAERNSSKFIQISPPSGDMTIDFSEWGSNTQNSDTGLRSTADSAHQDRVSDPQQQYHESFDKLPQTESGVSTTTH